MKKNNQLTKEEKSALVRAYRNFMITKAGHLRPEGAVEMEDLVQEGLIVMLEMAETYDPSTGQTFIDYISIPVQHRMSDFIRQYGCTVTRPAHSRIQIFMDPIDNYTVDDGSDEEAMRQERYEQLLDFQPDMDKDARIELMKKAIKTLSPMEQDVIVMTYGPLELSDEEIAKQLNKTVAYVRRVRDLAVRKLQVRINQIV